MFFLYKKQIQYVTKKIQVISKAKVEIMVELEIYLK